MKLERESLTMTITQRILAATLAFCIAGCGRPQANYDNVELVDVEGTVLLDGAPVSGAVVQFEDAETGLKSFGLTDGDGRYQLKFDSFKSGIIPGEKRVVISTTMKVLGVNSDDEGGETEEEGDGKPEPKTEQIPEEYRGDTNLRTKVTSTTTEVNFDLAGDGSTTGPTGIEN